MVDSMITTKAVSTDNSRRVWVTGLSLGLALVACLVASLIFAAPGARANPAIWQFEWPNTDFARASVPFETIISGFGNAAVGRDRIPAISNPTFGSIAAASQFVTGNEPVITVELGGEAKAYPLSILIWHEIVNDVIGGVPVAVTFCPLCNSSVVFNRVVDGVVLDFGVTGKLRNSDLIMFDRQTESWWQQFTGEGIVGALTGAQLEIIPVRVESFDLFKGRFPGGSVMQIPAEFARSYGQNPYTGYDSLQRPPLFLGTTTTNAPPLSYVVAVGDRAWSLDLLRENGRIITEDGLILEWTPGQTSVLDTLRISDGRELGNVTVRRQQGGAIVDVAHDTTFAFAFSSFFPQGVLHE